MRPRTRPRHLPAAALGLSLTLALALAAAPDGPPARYDVVSPKAVDINATGMNGRGEVIGFEWVEDPKTPGVVNQQPFFARGKDITYLPLLKGYTATFPAAVSDGGLVVGRVSKPATPALPTSLRNQAFAWDAAGGIRGLGALPDDLASFASGVSRDGRTVSGFSVGQGRVRPCVWERRGDGAGAPWEATPLPSEGKLGSTAVPLSGDGRHAAAVDDTVPYLWSRGPGGSWGREVIGEGGAFVPRGVNDSGTVVGVRFAGEGVTHARVWTRAGGLQTLPEPPGFTSSEALAVNNAGAVVGSLDGPHGGPVGPAGFVFEGGRLRVLDEGGPRFAGATAVNDRGQVTGVLEEPEPAAP